jgi:hypothetical protein
MRRVDLWKCAHCGLVWVRDTELIPGFCPGCRYHHTVPKKDVQVAGQKISVKTVMEYGSVRGLLDFKVRRGLEILNLGYCEHGFIAASLCEEGCNSRFIDNGKK